MTAPHPTEPEDFTVRAIWKFQLLGWGCLYLMTLAATAPEIRRLDQIGTASIDVGALFLTSFLMWPLCRRLLRRPLTLFALEIWALLLSLAIGIASASLVDATLFEPRSLASRLFDAFQYAIALFLWCSLYFSVAHWRRAGRVREKLLQAQSEARAARLDALRYQLNPHFLFNSLNAVSTLVIEGEAAAATRMLSQISDFLRTLLDADIAAELTLAEEIAFTRQYLAIEQTRLGERLKLRLDVADDALDALVPTMLLQPLAENAVRHGIACLVEGGLIGIEARISDFRLRIAVTNSGPIPASEAVRERGIGLANTAERLSALYGGDHALEIERLDKGGCTVTIDLPLRLPCAS